MKKTLMILCVMIFFSMGINGFARLTGNWDFGLLSYGSPPVSGYKGALGGIAGLFEVGLGIDLSVEEDVSEIQLRMDFGVYSWENDSNTFGSGDYNRLPFFIGPRVYLYLSDDVLIYGEAGFEISFDDFAVKETNFGVTPGAGFELRFGGSGVFGVKFRYHLIQDSYFAIGPYFGWKYN
ncbi:MAG: hypothetical protein IEMM0008_0936 [bacterium]|nr:MAG: hypothetical protein IEMM0008_0936 [bacterium]